MLSWEVPNASERDTKSQVAHIREDWLHHLCRLGGSPTLPNRGRNQKCPTCGHIAYINHAVFGGPQRFGAESKIESGPHVGTLYITPAFIGGSHRFTAADKIKNGPHMGKMAASPLRLRGSPTLQCKGQNEKWPTCAPLGSITHAIVGGSVTLPSGGQNHVWPTCGHIGYISHAILGGP